MTKGIVRLYTILFVIVAVLITIGLLAFGSFTLYGSIKGLVIACFIFVFVGLGVFLMGVLLLTNVLDNIQLRTDEQLPKDDTLVNPVVVDTSKDRKEG